MAEDIQKQLPTEAEKFKKINKDWKNLMMDTNKKKLIHEMCCVQEHNHKKLRLNNEVLDDIQKRLDDYLDKKRMVFPRF